MKPEDSVSTLSEVYFRIIEKTCNALKNYLNKTQKNSNRFDIVEELKKRWIQRIELLISSMNGSWSKFQDSCIQKNNKETFKEDKKILLHNVCFPSICSLSWDLYRYSKPNRYKTSNFKLWVWNCMISSIANSGNMPMPSFLFSRNTNFPMKLIGRTKVSKSSKKINKNIFYIIKNLKKQNQKTILNNTNIFFPNIIGVSKRAKDKLAGNLEKDLSEEISVEEFESNLEENLEKTYAPNFLLAVIEKVYRRNTKWTVILKDGILNINKKDFLFNSCKCEFLW